MTNKEFKEKNYEFVAQMYNFESAIFQDIKSMFGDISLPNPTDTFKTKLDEIFVAFEDDDKPLDQHLTVIISSQFFLNQCASMIQNIDKYVKSIISTNEKEKMKELFDMLPNMESQWKEKETDTLNIDLQTNLAEMINSMPQLPGGLSKEMAHKICTSELQKVNYQPKEKEQKGFQF